MIARAVAAAAVLGGGSKGAGAEVSQQDNPRQQTPRHHYQHYPLHKAAQMDQVLCKPNAKDDQAAAALCHSIGKGCHPALMIIAMVAAFEN